MNEKPVLIDVREVFDGEEAKRKRLNWHLARVIYAYENETIIVIIFISHMLIDTLEVEVKIR